MPLIAHLVTRNEAGRYLKSCLDWLASFVDSINVFDDFSADATAAICLKAGAHVTERGPALPSFLDHEGRFRQAAWESLVDIAAPGDWVFAVDADEFLVSTAPEGTDLRDVVDLAIREAEMNHAASLRVAVREVWGFEEDTGRPLIRVDGWWGRVMNVRIASWSPDALFQDLALGCGSVPDNRRLGSVPAPDIELLHYGYAAVDDRRIRFDRYDARPGQHNPKHVRSILEQPALRVWKGDHP